MRYLDLLGDFLEEPELAAEAAARERPLAAGALGFLVGGLSASLAAAVVQRSLLPPGPATWLLAGAWHLACGFFLAGALHLAASASGETGDAAALFVLLGLSDLAWALAVPAALALRAAGVDGWPRVALVSLLPAAAGLALRARCLRCNYRLGAGKAWCLLLAPYAVLLLSLGVALFAALAGALWSLARLLV